jgi:hypothetical protein
MTGIIRPSVGTPRGADLPRLLPGHHLRLGWGRALGRMVRMRRAMKALVLGHSHASWTKPSKRPLCRPCDALSARVSDEQGWAWWVAGVLMLPRLAVVRAYASYAVLVHILASPSAHECLDASTCSVPPFPPPSPQTSR